MGYNIRNVLECRFSAILNFYENHSIFFVSIKTITLVPEKKLFVTKNYECKHIVHIYV